MKNNIFKNIIDYIRYSSLFILLMFTVILVLTTTLFIFDITISNWHLPLSLIITVLTFCFIFKELKFKNAISIIISIVFILLAIFACMHFFDLSWDGSLYHKDAVGLLKNGWNPLYDNYTNFYNNFGIRDMEFIGNDYYLKPGMWVTHYAQGIWIIDAVFYKILNNIEFAKIFNILFIYISFGLTLSCVYKKTNKVVLSVFYALLFSITPVTLVQAFTYYNDGALYSVLTCLIIVFSLFAIKSELIPKRELYIWIICLLIIAINVKFTCFAYAGIFCLGLYLLYLWNNYKDKTFKTIIKPTVMLIITVLVATLVVGSTSYVKNFINNGHPMYPLFGEDKVDIMYYNEPTAFADKGNMYKLTKSLFSEVSNAKYPANIDINFKIPFSVSKDELNALQKNDLRISGFGVFYGGIFIISIIICIFGLIVSYKKNRKLFQITAVILFVSILLSVGLSESWWARYSPFIYYIPLVALIYILILFSNKIIRISAMAVLISLMIFNMFFFFKYNFYNNYKEAAYTRKILTKYQKNNTTITLVDEERMFYGMLYNLDDYNIKYQITKDVKKKDKHLFRYVQYRVEEQ